MEKKNEIFPMDAVSILLSELLVQRGEYVTGVNQAKHSAQVIASIRAVLDQYDSDLIENLVYTDYGEDPDPLLDALEMDVSQVNVLESADMPQVNEEEYKELQAYKLAWFRIEQYINDQAKDKSGDYYLQPIIDFMAALNKQIDLK